MTSFISFDTGGLYYYYYHMARCYSYSAEDIRKSYEKISEHKRLRSIILKYSINPGDVRDTALAGLDLSRVRTVLDLGCGYGFFTEKLVGLLRDDVIITGIDLLESNRGAFLDTVASMGYRGAFIVGNSELLKRMSPCMYDLVIASYSLYFFPHLAGEIARVLRNGGMFLAVTHSRFTLREVLPFIPACMKHFHLEPPGEIAILRLFSSFSLENGAALLEPHFEKVERITFLNELLFERDDMEEFLQYLNGKEYLFMKDVWALDPENRENVKKCFYRKIHDYALQRENGVTITKDDGIFRCYKKPSGLDKDR